MIIETRFEKDYLFESENSENIFEEIYKYIIENQLICNYEADGTNCIYDDDEHKKCRSKKLKFSFSSVTETFLNFR